MFYELSPPALDTTFMDAFVVGWYRLHAGSPFLCLRDVAASTRSALATGGKDITEVSNAFRDALASQRMPPAVKRILDKLCARHYFHEEDFEKAFGAVVRETNK